MDGKMTFLSSYLDDGGWHTEAENVRNGVDLESYENELSLIDWLLRHAHLAQPSQAVDVGQVKGATDVQELLDARELCAWRTYERNRSVMRAERAESRLAAADALLREVAVVSGQQYDMTVVLQRIQAHLSEPRT